MFQTELIKELNQKHKYFYCSGDGDCFVTIFNSNLTIHKINQEKYEKLEYQSNKFYMDGQIMFYPNYIVWASIVSDIIHMIRMDCDQFRIIENNYSRITHCIPSIISSKACSLHKRSLFTISDRGLIPYFNTDSIILEKCPNNQFIIITNKQNLSLNNSYHNSMFNRTCIINAGKKFYKPDGRSVSITNLLIRKCDISQQRFSKEIKFYLKGDLQLSVELNCCQSICTTKVQQKMVSLKGNSKIIRRFYEFEGQSNNMTYCGRYIIHTKYNINFIYHKMKAYVLDILTAKKMLIYQSGTIKLSKNFAFLIENDLIKIYKINT